MAASALATAFVNIVPGTQDLERYLKTGMPQQGKQGGQGLGDGMKKGFGSKIGGFMAPVAAAFSVVAIGRFVGDMYQAAVEGQKVDATLGKVADSMGLFGGQTGTVVDRLKDFATEQMKLTGTDDEVIKGAQTKLLTFKNLAATAGEAGGMFDRATVISQDMAAVFGGDASSKAVMLGKALNDPIKGVASLSRVGVQFTDDQKKMIEGMVAVGDMAGAQELIMKELETQVGGTAEASATAGEKMRARFDDAIESLGTTLMPVFDGITAVLADHVVPAFEDAAEGVKGFLGWFGDNQGWLLPVLGGIAGILLSMSIYTTALGIAATITALGGLPAIIISTWLWTAALLANPITWIILGIGLLIAALIFLAMNWDEVTKWVGDVWNSFTGWLSDSLEGIGKGWNDFWKGVGDFFVDLWNGIVDFLIEYWPYILGIFTGGLGLIVGLVIQNWDAIAKVFTDAWKGITKWLGGAIDSFVKFWQNAWTGIGDFVGDVFKNIVGFVKAPLNAIIGLVNKAIGAINQLKIEIPDWVPGLGGQTLGFNIPKIPALAKGGFVDSPTTALIGEAGPEVVTPLKDFERMMGIGDGAGKTINYYAAPNQSIDSEQALFTAIKRAKVVASW